MPVPWTFADVKRHAIGVILIVALFAAVLALDPLKWTNNVSPVRSVDTVDAIVRSVQWDRVGHLSGLYRERSVCSLQGQTPASDRRACNHRARHARQWLDLLPVSRMSGGWHLFPRPVYGERVVAQRAG
jgi:hypothetical protein